MKAKMEQAEKEVLQGKVILLLLREILLSQITGSSESSGASRNPKNERPSKISGGNGKA